MIRRHEPAMNDSNNKASTLQFSRSANRVMNRHDLLVWLSLAWFVAVFGAAIWVLSRPACDVSGSLFSLAALPVLLQTQPARRHCTGEPMRPRGSEAKRASRPRIGPVVGAVAKTASPALSTMLPKANDEGCRDGELQKQRNTCRNYS
jgi:hypothetical protein